MSEAPEREDMALYIGPNRDRLMRFYGASARDWLFCWPGALLPQAWFLYRKMYLWAALVCAGPLLLSYIPGAMSLSWGTSVVGAFGVRLYFAQGRRIVARIRADVPDDEAARALIARAGGVSWIGAAFGLAFAFSAFVMSLKAGAPAIFGR